MCVYLSVRVCVYLIATQKDKQDAANQQLGLTHTHTHWQRQRRQKQRANGRLLERVKQLLLDRKIEREDKSKQAECRQKRAKRFGNWNNEQTIFTKLLQKTKHCWKLLCKTIKVYNNSPRNYKKSQLKYWIEYLCFLSFWARPHPQDARGFWREGEAFVSIAKMLPGQMPGPGLGSVSGARFWDAATAMPNKKKKEECKKQPLKYATRWPVCTWIQIQIDRSTRWHQQQRQRLKF